MSRAICSARASSTAAAAFRYAARRAIGSAAQSANAASAAAATAASASASLDDENSPTDSDGRIGFSFVYVSPDEAGTQAPPT